MLQPYDLVNLATFASMAGIYLHIPFCKQACNYCNFHFSTTLKGKEAMLSALKKEITLRKDYLEGQDIETIYFGGGTPSLLSADEISRLWEVLDQHFALSHLKEVTLEANPDNLNQEYLKNLRKTPINRLSIGIQSFHEQDLTYMNRAHTATEADYAVKAAQDHGFENISIDLIYGTPTMTHQAWRQNIQSALDLKVPHISSYALTVEPKTALAHAIEKGKTKEPDNAQAASQFETLIDELQLAGYEHYEISNFALPGQYAVHNTNYWNNKHYVGLGPSAHSFNGSSRQWNVAHNALYTKSLLEDHKIPFEREHLSFNDRHNEYLMTSLRTMWGTDLDHIHNSFGPDAEKKLRGDSLEFQEKGWLVLNNNKLILTTPGKLFADRIAAELFL